MENEKKNKTIPSKKDDSIRENMIPPVMIFPGLIASCAGLAPFVHKNRYGQETVNFDDPAAVRNAEQSPA